MAKREINLALQGGGAHGAFTWGVLDRLLDAPEIEVAAISGTSAGALNGAAFKAGLVSGGREGARDNLDWLWQQVMQLDDISMAQWFAFPGMEVGAIAKVLEYSPGYAALDLASRMMSPYQYGALYQNPLEKIAPHRRRPCP
ncbi:MAG: patatin-like phospholipase family protein, partial [Pseudomonadota bacterium]